MRRGSSSRASRRRNRLRRSAMLPGDAARRGGWSRKPARTSALGGLADETVEWPGRANLAMNRRLAKADGESVTLAAHAGTCAGDRGNRLTYRDPSNLADVPSLEVKSSAVRMCCRTAVTAGQLVFSAMSRPALRRPSTMRSSKSGWTGNQGLRYSRISSGRSG